MIRSALAVGLLVVMTGCSATDNTPDYADHPVSPDDILRSNAFVAAASSALGEGDIQGYQTRMDSAHTLRPEQAVYLFHAARSSLAADDTVKAIELLNVFAGMGMTRDLMSDPVFAGMHGHDGFLRIVDDLAANAEPRGAVWTVAQGGDPDLVPEGVAWDPQGDKWFVGSVREGLILELTPDSVRTVADGLPSVMGITWVDGRLYAAVTRGPNLATTTEWTSGVVVVDPSSGDILRHIRIPDPADADTPGAWPGDLIVAADGTVYVSDSVRNVIWRAQPGSDVFEEAVSSPWFASLQGLTFLDDGQTLVVADYTAGLLRVDPVGGTVERMRVPYGQTLLGVDGLYRASDGLIAIQNGTAPQRILHVRLSEDARNVASVETLAANHDAFDEPTLGVVTDSAFVFVANSHWGHFTDGAQMDADRQRTAPRLMAVRLP
jgi:sugar lactone lactonase YvrE